MPFSFCLSPLLSSETFCFYLLWSSPLGELRFLLSPTLRLRIYKRKAWNRRKDSNGTAIKDYSIFCCKIPRVSKDCTFSSSPYFACCSSRISFPYSNSPFKLLNPLIASEAISFAGYSISKRLLHIRLPIKRSSSNVLSVLYSNLRKHRSIPSALLARTRA